jgi:flagellar basal-body rod modification protein FlgD
MTSVTSSTSSTTTTTAAATAASQLAATQDRFLKLLVTQLQNQDPLNPMDNSQVTSQMAQLSTVSGINQLNTTVQALSDSLTTSQSLQATSMIGQAVLVPGDQIVMASGSSNAAVKLSQAEDQVTVTISDSSGNVVRTMKLGAQSAGIVDFTWDGKNDSGTTLTDGTYTYTASAVVGTTTSTPTTLTYGLVNSVSLSSGTVELNVGNLGDVSLDSVLRIL